MYQYSTKGSSICNFKFGPNFSQPKILVGPNFSRPIFLAGPNFSHQGKIWSLRTDEVWADKVVDTFSQELTKMVILFSKTILNPIQKVFSLKKTNNRIHVSAPSFLVPWFYISTSFYKTIMFLKKLLCSPQTKINYLERFSIFFSLFIFREIFYFLQNLYFSQ